jgi:FkbM family methyltransferase
MLHVSENLPTPSIRVTCDGIKFLNVPTRFRQITEVSDYSYDDIQRDDIVIDIGANVGAFCIRAARYSDHVFAVEPVATCILRENIRLNDVAVQVIEGALGDGTPHQVCWDDCTVIAPTFTLKKIIDMAGGCDFLKCDCEGGEWHIDPGDLDSVRRIEMELHLPPIGGQPAPELLDYLSRHFIFEIDRVPAHGPLGLFGFLHATRKR